MAQFPKKTINSLVVEDLTSYLVQLKNMGLNIYSLNDKGTQFEVMLSEKHSIRCSFNGSKCQLTLLAFGNLVNFLDVTNTIQMEGVFKKYITQILGSYPASSASARLSDETPASNFQSLSNLLGTSQIMGVFDPYLENSSLTTLIDICSFGSGTIGGDVRLLGSQKKAGGNNPTFTKTGVDAFLTQCSVSGEGRVLASNSEHRRFILLSGGKSLLLGQSLNSIHKNEASRIEADTEDLIFFDTMWSTANPLT